MTRRLVEAFRRYFAQGPRRLRTRRRLVLFSLPAVALLLAVSWRLFWVCAAGQAEIRLFDQQDVPGLHGETRSLLEFNEVEPWKAHFAEADAYVLEGRLPDAEREFYQAVALAGPDESCPARTNLVVVLESLADEKTKAGSLAEARAEVAKAQKTMADAPPGCFAPKPHAGVDDEDLRLYAETTGRLAAKAAQLSHGHLRYDEQGGTYRYTPGNGVGKLDPPPGPGPCPQTDDPAQTACIRNKDAPGPSGGGPDPQDRPGDSAPPPEAPPHGGETAPLAPPSGGDPGDGPSATGRNQGKPSIDDVGPDRLPAPGSGPVQHKLNPQSGDPAEKLQQAQTDANGSGEDSE